MLRTSGILKWLGRVGGWGLGVAWIGVVGAADPGAAMSLDHAVQRAWSGNTDLAAARWVVEEARGRAAQAGRWANPELEGEVAPLVRGRELRFSAGFSQRFPVTARLRAERSVARLRLAAAEAEVREAERQLAAAVRETGVRLMVLEARGQLRQRQTETARDLASALRRAAGAGEGGVLEAEQVDLELARLETERLRADLERAGVEGRFRQLLGLAPEAPLRWSEALPEPGPEGDPEPDLVQPPALAVARLREEAANASIELARSRRWEDLRAGVFGEVDRSEDAPQGIETDHRVGLRFSIPLPLWDRGRGRVDEAVAAAERAERERGALEHALRAEAATAVEQKRAARRWIRALVEDLLPRATRIEAQAFEAHRQGQRPLAEALRARERHLELAAALVDAKGEYQLAHQKLLSLAAPVPVPTTSATPAAPRP